VNDEKPFHPDDAAIKKSAGENSGGSLLSRDLRPA
jgi:hypothetical protein